MAPSVSYPELVEGSLASAFGKVLNNKILYPGMLNLNNGENELHVTSPEMTTII